MYWRTENARREVLEAVFAGFVVDQKRVVDMEVRPPCNWLAKRAPDATSVPMHLP